MPPQFPLIQPLYPSPEKYNYEFKICCDIAKSIPCYTYIKNKQQWKIHVFLAIIPKVRLQHPFKPFVYHIVVCGAFGKVYLV